MTTPQITKVFVSADCIGSCAHNCRIHYNNGAIQNNQLNGKTISDLIQNIGIQRFRIPNGIQCSPEINQKVLSIHFRPEKYSQS